MIEVIVAAPAPAMRIGLRGLLSAPDISIVSEVAALAATSLPPAHVIVSDESLLDSREALALGDGQYAMLTLGQHPRNLALLRDLPLSGWGVLPHDSNADELQATVRALALGLVVLPPNLVPQLSRGGQTIALTETVEPLTSREQEVLELLAQGLANKQIARSLQISEHTVKFHISSIFSKLGVTSRTEAISRGARQGFISI